MSWIFTSNGDLQENLLIFEEGKTLGFPPPKSWRSRHVCALPSCEAVSYSIWGLDSSFIKTGLYNSGWWFQTFFPHNIWDNPSHWPIFFKMVKTTNQYNLLTSYHFAFFCVDEQFPFIGHFFYVSFSISWTIRWWCLPTMCPPSDRWFKFAPITIVIGTINHSYWSYVDQLNAIVAGGLTLYAWWLSHVPKRSPRTIPTFWSSGVIGGCPGHVWWQRRVPCLIPCPMVLHGLSARKPHWN